MGKPVSITRLVLSSEARLTETQVDRIREAAECSAVEVCDRSQMTQVAPEAEVLGGMSSEIPTELFRRPGRLRWVSLFHAGVDKLLCPELIEADIVVTCAKGAHAVPIAEHVFAFMLAHVKELARHREAQLKGIWDRRPMGELYGKTLCVVGLGNIGVEIAKRANCFGMRVVGVRRTGEPVSGVETVVTPDRLGDLLPQADFVALTLPATLETMGLIGARELECMKAGSMLINVGRGKVVDNAALIAALRSGHLGGAGLDAIDPEPLPSDSELWRLPNVLITPHVSGFSPRIRDRAVTMFCENLRRYRRGEVLHQLVDKQAGY